MSNSEQRAYPRLQFVHVIIAGIGAAILVFAVWFMGVYVPAKRAYVRAGRAYALQRLGRALFSFEDSQHKAPNRASDLDQYLLDDLEVHRGLLNGEFVVAWDALDLGETARRSETVWGYERTAPVTGGNVLMGDGAINWMSPDELSAALRLARPPQDASLAPAGSPAPSE